MAGSCSQRCACWRSTRRRPLAACAPAAATLHRDVVRPVAARTVAVALVTTLAWAGVRWSPLTGRPGHLGLTIAALLGLALVATTAVVVLRADRPAD